MLYDGMIGIKYGLAARRTNRPSSFVRLILPYVNVTLRCSNEIVTPFNVLNNSSRVYGLIETVSGEEFRPELVLFYSCDSTVLADIVAYGTSRCAQT